MAVTLRRVRRLPWATRSEGMVEDGEGGNVHARYIYTLSVDWLWCFLIDRNKMSRVIF